MLRRVLLFAWLLLCVATLAVTLLAASPADGRNDIGLFFLGCMLVLTFPSGLGVVGVVALLVEAQSRTGFMTIDFIDSNYLGFVLTKRPVPTTTTSGTTSLAWVDTFSQTLSDSGAGSIRMRM